MRYTSDVTMRGSAKQRTVSLRITGRCAASAAERAGSSSPASRSKLNLRGSAIVQLGNKLMRSMANPRNTSILIQEKERGKIKSINTNPRLSAESIFDARNLFSTTLNEALCQHEDNPQDSLTMLFPLDILGPHSLLPATPRPHNAHTHRVR